ncbi:MAG: hypothetical protein AAB628_00360 [Patescibacteria group bacterium]
MTRVLEKLKVLKKRNFFSSIILINAGVIFVFLSITTAFAGYPATKYAPGETLNPACGPTDTNCGVEQITVATSTMNFGIGTTSPYAKLSVVGEIVGAYFTGTTTATSTFGGSVGIGTTSPYAKLSVVGEIVGAYFTSTTTATSTFGGSLAINGVGTSTGAGGFNLSAGCFAIGGICLGSINTSTLAGQFPFYSSLGSTLTATSSIFLASSGNVGIGTTTPAWNLQIAGIRPSVALSDTGSGTNLKHWLFSSMGGNLYIGTSTDAYATTTPSALTILNNGRVGIGTTNPASSLEVQGTGITLGGVTRTTWPTSGVPGQIWSCPCTNNDGTTYNLLAANGSGLRCAVGDSLAYKYYSTCTQLQ